LPADIVGQRFFDPPPSWQPGGRYRRFLLGGNASLARMIRLRALFDFSIQSNNDLRERSTVF